MHAHGNLNSLPKRGKVSETKTIMQTYIIYVYVDASFRKHICIYKCVCKHTYTYMYVYMHMYIHITIYSYSIHIYI